MLWEVCPYCLPEHLFLAFISQINKLTSKLMRIIRLFILSISRLIVNTNYAQNTYAVSYVYDGDTVKLRPMNANGTQGEFKLRLKDIFAPERNQAYGLKSRRALIKLCQGEFPISKNGKRRHPEVQGNDIIATVQISGIDKYNRALGWLQCDHIDASLYLAERGLAWHYAQYSKDIEIQKAAQNARRLKLGLWANEKPTPPWVWRHQRLH